MVSASSFAPVSLLTVFFRAGAACLLLCTGLCIIVVSLNLSVFLSGYLCRAGALWIRLFFGLYVDQPIAYSTYTISLQFRLFN